MSGNNMVFNAPSNTTGLTSPVMLSPSTTYQWSVTSINMTGQKSSIAPFSFTTKAPPPPPMGVLKLVPPITGSPAGWPKHTPVVVTVEVTNTGNAASQPYSVTLDETTNHLPFMNLLSTTQDMPALPAGGIAQAQFPATFVEGNAVRLIATLVAPGQANTSEFVIVP